MGWDTCCEVFDIIRLNIIAPLQCGKCLACTVEGKRSARADAKLHRSMATCRSYDCQQVTLHLRLPTHLANCLQRFKYLLLLKAMQDGLLILFRRIADLHAQQKTVELSLGKRKCAFQFNRVLRSDYQEGL